MPIDRRDKHRREEVIRLVVNYVVQSAERTVTIESLKDLLKIPEDGVHRVIASLVSAGILREISDGVWCRASR